MVDGTRRLIGLRLNGETEAEFLITDEDLRPEDIIEIGLITAMHRADLTGYEKWQACLKILERHPEWMAKDLAAHLNIDPSMVPRLMAASNTVPAVQEAFKAAGINQAQVYAISKEKASGFVCDGIVVRSGEPFANGSNWLWCEFSQKQ